MEILLDAAAIALGLELARADIEPPHALVIAALVLHQLQQVVSA